MKGAFHQLSGKTIKSVIVSENKFPPRSQVFLIFDDNTYYEIYGDIISGAGRVDTGGEQTVTGYAKKCGGIITRYPK